MGDLVVVTSQRLYLILLAAVGVERLIELAISRHNVAWALARGGVEAGRGHLLPMKVLHTGLLAGCVAEVLWGGARFSPQIGWPMLALVVAAQALRYWTIATLGRRWNVRVVVLPGEPVVKGGPFRLLRHPNYLAVVVEGFALPLLHGAWITAVSFSLLNGWLLAVRIRCEEAALAAHSDYRKALGARRRFLPFSFGAER